MLVFLQYTSLVINKSSTKTEKLTFKLKKFHYLFLKTVCTKSLKYELDGWFLKQHIKSDIPFLFCFKLVLRCNVF